MVFELKSFKFRPKTSRKISSTQARAGNDSPVRVSKTALIALNRQAEKISLKTAKIRAQQGGQYFSPFKGRGMEFDEVRPYQPGDDVRTIDWRVTARSGQPHTKLFREERERSVLFWVDYRAPMFFATRGQFKSVMAARAAALLSWSAVHHGDLLGGLVFSETQHQEMRPQRGKKGALHFIQCLTEHSAWGSKETGTVQNRKEAARQALVRLRRVAHPGSLIFLISDFRALGGEAEQHLAQLARHNDVVLIFIYDMLEKSLPAPGLYRMSDGSTKEISLDTTNGSFCRDYQLKFQQRTAILNTLCRRYRMSYLPCDTSGDLFSTLQQGLGLKRGRS